MHTKDDTKHPPLVDPKPQKREEHIPAVDKVRFQRRMSGVEG